MVVNPGTSRCPTVDLELVQTTRNVNGTRLIPFGNSNRENGPIFLDFPLFLGIFQWDEPTKRVPFTAEPKIPEILTKWKAPQNTTKLASNSSVTFVTHKRLAVIFLQLSCCVSSLSSPLLVNTYLDVILVKLVQERLSCSIESFTDF